MRIGLRWNIRWSGEFPGAILTPPTSLLWWLIDEHCATRRLYLLADGFLWVCRHNATLGVALRPENIRDAKEKAQSLLADVLATRKQFGGGNGSGTWIFGDDVGPTVLDGHIVPFVARMVDVEREDLVPAELLEATKKAMERPEWLQVMHGRRTWYDRSYGPVSSLKEV